MIDNWLVQQAFREKVITVNYMPDEQFRAWENKVFQPVKGERWIRETFMPGDERLKANNEIEGTGICQYDYFVPIGASIKDAKKFADSVKEAFKPTSVLDGIVRIDRSYIIGGSKGTSGYQSESQESEWYKISILIDYVTFSTN